MPTTHSLTQPQTHTHTHKTYPRKFDTQIKHAHTIEYAATCTEDEYTCLNGDCIPNDRLCDGHNDCEGGDDESSCQTDAATDLPYATELPDTDLYPTEAEIDGKSSQW